MVGGFFENAISREILSSSFPYYQDDLTWCVPPADLASNLTNVIGIFSFFIWTLTVVALIASGLIILVQSHREEYQNNENLAWSLLISFAFTLSNAAHFFPKRIPTLVFLSILMFYAQHINIIYHSFLITVLTRPKYEQQIANQRMAVDAEMIFYGNEDTLANFENKANDSIAKKITMNFQICTDIDACLQNIQTDKKAAVAVSRHHSDNNPIISRRDMFCFTKSNNIYTYSVSMLTKKFYHLLPKINYVIRGITESGLLKKWQEDTESHKTKAKINTGGHGGGGDVVKLRIGHVLGGFLLWGLGLLFAFLTFLGEILYDRWTKKNLIIKNNTSKYFPFIIKRPQHNVY